MSATTPTPLSLLSVRTEITTPFDADFIGDRKDLANKLTTYVDRMRAGAVIGISAPWGEGKSWFGQHWAAQLRQAGHKVAFIDAFASDYLEDPFILIASELGELIEGNAQEVASFRKKAARAAKAILPFSAKVLVKLAGRAVGVDDIPEAFAETTEEVVDGAANASEKWFEERLASVQKERASVEAFKDELEKAAIRTDNPVVVFVDELDRCKPTFAITLIERLKHLFDVPNLVFVLLVNRPQLERAIEGQYGQGTDGSGYLSKFINLWFELPRGALGDARRNRKFENFIDENLKKYKLNTQIMGGFKSQLVLWGTAYDFSLRDLERACALASLVGEKYDLLSPYLVAQKIKDNVRFSKLRRFDKEAHLDCFQELNSLSSKLAWRSSHGSSNLLLAFQELHKHAAGDIELDQCKHIEIFRQALFNSDASDFKDWFSITANLIDLPVQSR